MFFLPQKHASPQNLGLFVGNVFVALWLMTLPAQAQPFLERVERATPPERVRLVLFYFDTCRVVTTQQTVAFRTLDQLDAVAQRQRDDQLRRYARMLRDTYAKNVPNRSYRQNAELFLSVAQQADLRKDTQIAGVCEHFAGQYYFLAEDYGRAFEYLLSANSRFGQIGYARIPEIQRYLYELAFNYYYLNEDQKVIYLLTEAGQFPPFNPNLHIQTHNTLAMAYARLHNPEADRQAGANYQKAYALAVSYRDSVWMGIVRGNLGDSYARLGQWQQALDAFRTDYRLVMREARTRGYPLATSVGIAEAFYQLGQLDSCRYYLEQAGRMYKLQVAATDYSRSLQNDQFWQHYYEVSRQYYQTTGKLPEVARCTDSLLVYQARIAKRYRSKAALLAEQRLLVQKHQTEVANIEQQYSQQRLWLIAGGIVTLLMAGLLGLLYRTSQRRRQQEAQANSQRQQQLEQEKEHVTAELTRARADLKRFLEKREQTNLLQTQPDPTLAAASLLTPDDWAEFRRRFERAHPLFFAQLRTQFADLTPAEERLLALSKLSMDTRQMGRMLGISPSSVRTTKYRLRKRLGIDGQSALLGLLE